ncbi:MAG: RNB domain-containing ribonuclease, partial [Bdellovibrionales bacterium]|nr:RNB domain-containing ribonuclease [Bdellovibrionales bacterium]
MVALIGDVEDPQNDSLRVLHAHSIPFEISEETLKYVESFPDEVRAQDLKGRKDLTKENFITIDGKTAKDFDDAILVKERSEGFRLWVAIADVSHY